MKVDLTEVPGFYRPYVEKIADADLIPILLKTGDDLVEQCKNLTEARAHYRYEEGKWSIKDLIQHLIDSERVFSYRATRFARNDQTELSGFEQDNYVMEAKADRRPLYRLLNEFTNVRASTIDLFSSFDTDARTRKGVASGVVMTVEVLGYVIAGHTHHHLSVIQDRYLQ